MTTLQAGRPTPGVFLPAATRVGCAHRLHRESVHPADRPIDRVLIAMTHLVAAAVVITGSIGVAQGAETVRLVGTVALTAGQADPSHAVFETEDGRQIIMDVGQEIDGCRLASVHARHVVMDCAEGSVSLMLRSDLTSSRAVAAERAAVYQVTLPRDAFPIALERRQHLASQLSLEPAVRDGWLYGYRVAWLALGGEFYRLGLRPEDVVVSLNKVPASSAGPFMHAVGSLPGQSSFELTVERSGELIDYRYLFD